MCDEALRTVVETDRCPLVSGLFRARAVPAQPSAPSASTVHGTPASIIVAKFAPRSRRPRACRHHHLPCNPWLSVDPIWPSHAAACAGDPRRQRTGDRRVADVAGKTSATARSCASSISSQAPINIARHYLCGLIDDS